MRKIISIGLVMCLAAALFAGCGSGGSAGQDGSSSGGYQKGELTDLSYSSEYLGLRFTLPKGFIMASQEDMDEMMEIGSEMMDMDSRQQAYAAARVSNEMMASALMGLPNVIVMSERLAFRNMTVEQYFDVLKSQLEEMGYKFEETIRTRQIAGQSYQEFTATVSTWGVDMMQSYIMRKQDDRVNGFVVTYSLDTVDEKEILMNAFTEY